MVDYDKLRKCTQIDENIKITINTLWSEKAITSAQRDIIFKTIDVDFIWEEGKKVLSEADQELLEKITENFEEYQALFKVLGLAQAKVDGLVYDHIEKILTVKG